MKTSNFRFHALSIGAAAAILAACGGSGQAPISVASQIGAPQTTNARSAVSSLRSVTFNYTGAQQNFMVPKGVSHVTVQVYGGARSSGVSPVRGGYVKAKIPVTPGESLAIFVGGVTFNQPFNGGGSGGFGTFGHHGEDGFGASDVRQGGNALTNRVVVAGGAGGDGEGRPNGGGLGGAGGGLVGGAGRMGEFSGGGGGGGGTQSSGGVSGSGGGTCGGPGTNGGLGAGGAGGSGAKCTSGLGGGGGGGGYYGGGGGGADNGAGGGGGGGGSSYIEPSARNVSNQQGVSTGGLIIISWQRNA